MYIVSDTKLMISQIIGLYVYKWLLLYNGWPKTVHISNQIILKFFNLCSKEAIENISYWSTVNPIDGYMHAMINPELVR